MRRASQVGFTDAVSEFGKLLFESIWRPASVSQFTQYSVWKVTS